MPKHPLILVAAPPEPDESLDDLASARGPDAAALLRHAAQHGVRSVRSRREKILALAELSPDEPLGRSLPLSAAAPRTNRGFTRRIGPDIDAARPAPPDTPPTLPAPEDDVAALSALACGDFGRLLEELAFGEDRWAGRPDHSDAETPPGFAGRIDNSAAPRAAFLELVDQEGLRLLDTVAPARARPSGTDDLHWADDSPPLDVPDPAEAPLSSDSLETLREALGSLSRSHRDGAFYRRLASRGQGPLPREAIERMTQQLDTPEALHLSRSFFAEGHFEMVRATHEIDRDAVHSLVSPGRTRSA